jgi:hypothetical protein
MRQLIGKLPIKNRNLVEEIYLTESVRCQDCQATAPVGIEVVTVRKEGEGKKIVKHGWYCRAHAMEYTTRAQDRWG